MDVTRRGIYHCLVHCEWKNDPVVPCRHCCPGLPRMAQPRQKVLLATAVEYGVVIGENGEEIATSQGHCDVISMETGCVLAESYERFCEGKWVGKQWVSDEGGVLNPVLETKSPKDLLKMLRVSSLRSPEQSPSNGA